MGHEQEHEQELGRISGVFVPHGDVAVLERRGWQTVALADDVPRGSHTLMRPPAIRFGPWRRTPTLLRLVGFAAFRRYRFARTGSWSQAAWRRAGWVYAKEAA